MSEARQTPSPLAGEGWGEGKDEGLGARLPSPSPQGGGGLSRFFRRGPWEGAATVIIGAGIVMLMQPLALSLYTYSFATILAGTVMFVIVSHFPD